MFFREIFGPMFLDCQCLSPAPGFLLRGYPVDVVMVLCLCLPLDCLGLPQGPLRVSGLTLCPTLSHLWWGQGRQGPPGYL